MGNVEAVRKLFQDFIAPDLKQIGARIEALEREMNLRFDSTALQAGSFEKEVDARFTALEKEIALRFTTGEQLAGSRQETVLSAMSAHHASIMNSLEMEKRLARLESEPISLAGQSQQQ